MNHTFRLLSLLVWMTASLLSSGVVAQDTAYCSAGQELDAGLCYPLCDAGYDAVGPVCWEQCPAGYIDDGAFCRKDVIINAKGSYGRGVGTVPNQCGAGQENDAGLCYPNCSSGYDGVGPVCWQSCPSGYTDDGAFCRRDVHIFAKDSSGCPWYNLCCASCPSGYTDDGCFCRKDAHIFAKDTYGRGVGTVPNQCGSGRENDAGLCYPTCAAGYDGVGPVCWERCPSGFIDDGAFCRKDAHIFAKDTYGRGVGTIPECEAASFSRSASGSRDRHGVAMPFTMILASDCQLPWGTDPGCTGDTGDCEIEHGRRTNQWFTKAMNDVQSLDRWPDVVLNSGGRLVEAPRGVIMNGDLTAFWHPWQVDMYRQHYDPAHADADPDVLQQPYFPGLGNHDYANNVDDCWGSDPIDWARYGANSCAAQAVRYMRGAVGCGTVSNFDASVIDSFDVSSMAYSWDLGGWHFVQLHNYATYTVPGLSVSDSIEWLANDLERATADGQRIAINMHDHGQHWSMTDAGFQEAIRETNLVVLFAGHLHSVSGRYGSIPNTDIPVYLSGSADTKLFLVVEFGDDYYSVGSVETADGIPRWRTTSVGGQLGSQDVPPLLCGNGVVNTPWEACDEGDFNGPLGTCDTDCQPVESGDDAGGGDTGAADMGADLGGTDAGVEDTGASDTADDTEPESEAGSEDSDPADAGPGDGGADGSDADSGSDDASETDSEAPDAGAVDSGGAPEDTALPDAEADVGHRDDTSGDVGGDGQTVDAGGSFEPDSDDEAPSIVDAGLDEPEPQGRSEAVLYGSGCTCTQAARRSSGLPLALFGLLAVVIWRRRR